MLKKVFAENKKFILFTYAILLVENAAFAAFPWLFGRAVDGLLRGDDAMFRTYMLTMAGGLVVGSFRRVMDTRVFSGIWKRFSTDMIVGLMRKGTTPEKTMVCGGLSARFVDFFEWHLPHGVSAVVHSTVALVVLWTSVPGPGIWLGLVAVALLLSADYVARKQGNWERKKIASMEKSTEAINATDPDKLVQSYDDRVHAYVKKSDWEATGWCVSDALSMVTKAVIVLTLVRHASSVGAILAATAYCSKLFCSMNTLAFFLAVTKDIGATSEKIAQVQGE